MQRTAPKRPLLLILLPLFALLLLAALWIVVAYRIGGEREEAQRRGLAESQAFVRLYEEHTVRLLRQIDQATQFLKLEYERSNGRVNLNDFVRRRGLLQDGLAVVIAVTDSQGNIVSSTRGEALSVKTSEFFQVHVEQDAGELYIGMPIVGRITKQWVIPLSRRLNRPDGSFAGIVTVSLNPQTLYTDYDTPLLGLHGSVALVGTDDITRVRRVGDRTYYGEKVDFASFKRGAEALPGESFVRASLVDGMRRIFSYRRLKDFPLIVIAGLAEDDVYAEFYRSRATYLWSAGLGSLFIAGFTFFLMLQGRALARSQREASHAQAVYRAAAEGSLDAFYILEAMRGADGRITDFRFTDVNRPGAAMLHLAREQIIGQALCELLPVNRTGGFFDKYVRVLETGKPLEEEFEIHSPDIHASWLRHQVVPVEGGIAITSRDITARKRAEGDLRQNRKFLQTLIDYIPVMIFAKSARPQDFGRYVVWNEAAEVVTGYAAEQVLGKTGAEVFPPELARDYEERDRKMLADPMVHDEPDHVFHRGDGGARNLHRVTLPIFDDDDKTEYILGVVEDITSRKRQELLLREQRAEMQAVNDASPLGLFRADSKGNFTYANRTYERITGLAPGEALGRGWVKTIHPDDRALVREANERLAREERTVEFSHRMARADGGIVWLAVKVAPVRVDGQVIGYVGSIDDITERRATMASRNMLATIIEASADFVSISAPDGSLTYLNPAARALAGIAPQAELSHSSLDDLHPAAGVARLRHEAIPTALKDGLWIGENAVWEGRRREVPVSQMVIAHRGADGGVEYFSSVMHDISADRNAKLALQDSESRMRTITDTLPAMVAFVDPELHYRFVNRAYERVFARPRAAILGLTIRELHGEDIYAGMEPHVRRALLGETVVFETDHAEKGEYRCYETTYIPQMRGPDDRAVEAGAGLPARGTVLGFHVMRQDITARKLEEKRLIQLAHVDSMTGLINRAGFQLKLEELMVRSQAEKSLLALMFLDIDHFKSVNDTHGHLVGDALLKAFAGRLVRSLRDSDVVSRLGGDEFTIILPNLRKPGDATAVASKIVEAMRPAFSLNQQVVKVTTSVGLAFYQGGDMSAETLIQRADEMLYQSKAAGRDTYNVAPLLRVQSRN